MGYGKLEPKPTISSIDLQLPRNEVVHTFDRQSRSPDLGPQRLDALMQVLLAFAWTRLVTPFSSQREDMVAVQQWSCFLCSPRDERDGTESRQGKS